MSDTPNSEMPPQEEASPDAPQAAEQASASAPPPEGAAAQATPLSSSDQPETGGDQPPTRAADEPRSPRKGSQSNAAAEQPADEEMQPADEEMQREWFILKVQVNREDSIRQALLRRIKIAGLEEFFGDIIVPTEDVAEFNKSGKRRIVKRKLYPGYILVNMTVNEDTWFLVRETPGVGDFTGSAGKPTPMDTREVERILKLGAHEEAGGGQVKTAIPFRLGDRVRVKDGNFQNFEGDVEAIDEANGRITVVITIFNRSTPVELEHWQLEAL